MGSGTSKSPPSESPAERSEISPAPLVPVRHRGHFSPANSRLVKANEDEGFGSFTFLPSEIKLQVLSHLSIRDVVVLSSCSVSLFEMCSADYIWKPIYVNIEAPHREPRRRHCCLKRTVVLSYAQIFSVISHHLSTWRRSIFSLLTGAGGAVITHRRLSMELPWPN